MKTLVSYFSCSGITKEKAQLIASAINADIHEIVPAEPYATEDLDWMDPASRTSLEAADDTFRPEIAKYINNMNEYDKVFVGFPIWWYKAPAIILTFLESYDFKGKTIIPFATSGGSPYGDSNDFLSLAIRQGTVLKEGMLCSFVQDDEIVSWAKEMNK